MNKTIILTICVALICSPVAALVVPSSCERTEPEVQVHGGGYSSARNGFETLGYLVLGVAGGVACVSLGWYILRNAAEWEEDEAEDGWEDDEDLTDWYEMGFTLIIMGLALPFAAVGGFE